MDPPRFDSDILQYARQQGIAVPTELRIASALSISEIIPSPDQYSGGIASGFKKFYSTARKDLEPQKLDLSRESALLLIAQKTTPTESPVCWDDMLPSINQLGTRSRDPPLQSEHAIHEIQSIVSRSESGFNSTCLKPEHAQSESQSVKLDSYFAPLIAQRLGFGTVWGPPKNYDTPSSLSEVLAQARSLGSVRLDLSKKARTLMSKDWRPKGEASSKSVDSIRYEMLFQHKTATLFHDMELVPEKVELHSGQSMQFKSAARTRKLAAMRQGKSPSNNTPLPTFLFPKDPALIQLREDRQALPSIPEDTQAENQSQHSRMSPCVQSGSPTKSPYSAADSVLHKVDDAAVPPSSTDRGRLQPNNISILTQIAQDVLDTDLPANGTASRPISIEASPELHTNASSVDGGVPVTPRSVDSEIAFPISDKLIPVISNPLSITGIESATERSENDNGKSVQRTGLTGTRPLENPPTAVLGNPSTSSIGLFSTGLGSLSTFMETRGIVTANGSSTSPYFPAHETNKINEQQHQQNQHIPSAFKPSTNSHSFATLAKIKYNHANMASDFTLFLSIDLLKTHLQVIQFLEQQPTPPRLIYREYKLFLTPTESENPHYQRTPPEADIIIAPSVGIILSSLHALTQTYLPGHRPKDPYIRSNPDVRSPLRERILYLAPRYEILYLLISHSVQVQANTSPAESLRMNNSIQESLHSLNVFCDSFSQSTTITPLQLPALPEHMTACILTLAAKHTYSLPQICIPVPDPDPNIYASFRGYVTLNQLLQDDETRWEIFLRAIGLNPFAARTVLDVLEVEGGAATGLGGELQYFPVKGSEKKQSALTAFIDMRHIERLYRFKGLIGDGLLVRLHDVIEVN
ncbi:uncharacterized protein N7503_008572 [Penicillium pulvis]|uniref:uncharacterized protein n=1 Tax=Penicillium pulvis TaxID=1562058 RepID=UPI0025467089|nr:uncharacterized protein N7503_008572 [Penicillium pulvis]KAJ5792594.1 hypothetical protein N7503_008572 [Penicillium pulvis]